MQKTDCLGLDRRVATRFSESQFNKVTSTAAQRNTMRARAIEDLGAQQAPDHGMAIAIGVFCHDRGNLS